MEFKFTSANSARFVGKCFYKTKNKEEDLASAERWVSLGKQKTKSRYILQCNSVTLKDDNILEYELERGFDVGRLDDVGHVWFGNMTAQDWGHYVHDVLAAVRDLRAAGIVHGYIAVQHFRLINERLVLTQLHKCQPGVSLHDKLVLRRSYEHDMYAAGQVIRWITTQFGSQLQSLDQKMLQEFLTHLTPQQWTDIYCPECALEQLQMIVKY